MGYRSLKQLLPDLERTGELLRVEDEVDARLEAAEIHRRVFASGGPALLFTNIKGCDFPMLSNLFGSLERARYLFRDTFDDVQQLIRLKVDPREFRRAPWRSIRAARRALGMRPRRTRRAAVLAHSTRIGALPHQVSWPRDGGAFLTLPQVYTEDADQPGPSRSNLGMYRVQLDGGRYRPDQEIGLHYQLHRGIGVHHSIAVRRGERLRVNIFLGGSPAMTLAAVMPLPEGMSELTFAGALAGHRIPLHHERSRLPVYGDADFCIVGSVDPQRLLPEGPFGDHLGYYSLEHDFPVLEVEHVYHREGAIWPFTVVGRPPQEDTVFGELIHELTGPVIPTVVHGVRQVHAVDAAGVHPLMLAVGSERYVPYQPRTEPQEILTQACAILGQGQMSLAKYLLIVAGDDNPDLDVRDIPAFFEHLLARIDWTRDLHFLTRTTIDTLDYSGSSLNRGSKVILAAAGPVARELPHDLPGSLSLPSRFEEPRVVLPGILAIQAPRYVDAAAARADLQQFQDACPPDHPVNAFPLLVLVDDSPFASRSVRDFLWVTFTRSDPATDIHGLGAFVEDKHWGCRGSLIIDARRKPHHAPLLEVDEETAKAVDARAARGGPLARYL